MTAPGDDQRHRRVDYDHIADVAERLAQAEGNTARTLEALARRGGERAERRHILASEARHQMERLERWAADLRLRATR